MQDTTRLLAPGLVRADDVNRLVAQVRAGTITPSPGTAVENYSGGVSVRPIQNPLAAPKFNSSSASIPAHPFRVTLVGTDKATFYPGYVNGLPATIGGVSIATVPAPELTTGTTALNAYLEVSYDANFDIVSVAILSGNAPADVIDFATPANTKIRVQVCSGTRSAYAEHCYNNLSVFPTPIGAFVSAR